VGTSRGDDISSNETVVNIDADAVFVAIVVDPIFLDPSSVQVLLAQAIWIFLPALRHPPRFDFLVLLARVSLLWNWHKSRIDDLAATGLQTLGSEVLLKQLKISSIRPAFLSRSLKKAIVVASGILFITPRPTNSSKDRLSFT
jgi:hypothetical protein